jgi:argininosuccinate lyase
MSFATWMECPLGHMWSEGEDHCPVCGRIGWMHSERVEDDVHHVQRALVIKQVADLEAQIRHLRQVVAEQAQHHKEQHPECLGVS